jgi:uncharacterized membrane protein required for colicin V production
MVMDIVTCCIVALAAIIYARRGFAIAIMSILQWFLCIVVGLLFCSRFKDLIVDKTTLDESMDKFFAGRMSDSITDTSVFRSMPKLFDSWMKDTTDYVANTTAAGITSIILTIASFIIIVIAVKLVCWLFKKLLSKKHHKGVIGFVDGFFGLILGIFMGFFFVLVIFAVMVPVLGLLPSGASEFINHSFDTSYFSGEIYDHNFLLELVKNLFA